MTAKIVAAMMCTGGAAIATIFAIAITTAKSNFMSSWDSGCGIVRSINYCQCDRWSKNHNCNVVANQIGNLTRHEVHKIFVGCSFMHGVKIFVNLGTSGRVVHYTLSSFA